MAGDRPEAGPAAWAERFGARRLPASNWALAFGSSLLNWFTDASVLAVAIIAVGAHVPWHDLLLVYAVGVGAQGLSLTPGGLAITEGAISLALVASGMNVRQAVAAAVLYRLISFWFNAAIGWLILLFLQVRRPAAQSAPEPVLEPSAEPAPADSTARARARPAPRPARQRRRLGGRAGPAAGPPARGSAGPPRLRRERAQARRASPPTPRRSSMTWTNGAWIAAVLVAHSWAGGAALLAARLAPRRVKAVVLLAGVGPGSVSIVDWLLAAPVIGPLAAQAMWRWTPWIARAWLAWLSGREGRPLYPGEHLEPAGLGGEAGRPGAAVAHLPHRAAGAAQ